MTKTTETSTRESRESNLPGFVVKTREGRGKNATYERIGVAWENEDGSLYVKLHGKQIIEHGFTLYRLKGAEEAGE